jgi:hypothetical protein
MQKVSGSNPLSSTAFFVHSFKKKRLTIVTSLSPDLGKRKACRCCEQEFGHSVPEFVSHRDTVDGWKQISLIGKITLSAKQLRMLGCGLSSTSH